MKIKKTGIIGRGAIGVMYGAYLSEKTGRDNVIMIADEERAARYRKEKVTWNGRECDFRYETPATAEPVDLLIFAVKSTGLFSAVETARSFTDENTVIISILNGISSEEEISKAYGGRKVVYCCVQGMDAEKEGSAASCTNMGSIAIGNPDGSIDGDILALREFFEETGLTYVIPDDIVKKQWNKLMLNTGVNQVTALYKAPYELVMKEGEARDMMIEAMREVKIVANAEGVDLSDKDIETWLDILDKLNPKSHTSMSQDAIAGRPTEVELFSGTMLKLAEKHGIELKVNKYLYDRLK